MKGGGFNQQFGKGSLICGGFRQKLDFAEVDNFAKEGDFAEVGDFMEMVDFVEVGDFAEVVTLPKTSWR